MSAAIIENIIPTGLLMFAHAISDNQEKSMVNRWLQEYEAHRERKMRPAKVFAAVADGYDLLTEIASETGIPQTSVHRILSELVERSKIRSVKVKNHNCKIELRYEIIS